MYLFVYIFLLLSIMGMYTELYVLQTSSLFSGQKTAAQLMNLWHSGAYKLAKDYTATTLLPAGQKYCFLTPWSSLVPPCSQQMAVSIGTTQYLPPGYMMSDVNLQWPSVYLQDDTNANLHYVVTYVAATGTSLGYDVWDIMRQMNNAHFPKTGYGQVLNLTCNGVTGHFVVTGVTTGTGEICYPVTSLGVSVVPDGAVAFVSIL